MFNLRERKKKKASTSYYLGYVDDDETPEMIAKKFEELEKFQRQNGQELNEKEQEKLYDLTSSILVQEDLFGGRYEDEFENLDIQEEDDEEDEENDQDYKETFFQRKKNRRSRRRSTKVKNESMISYGDRFIMEKKKEEGDPFEIERIKLPKSTMPTSWAKTILPLTSYQENQNSFVLIYEKVNYYETKSIKDFNFSQFPKFQGIYIHSTKDLSKLNFKHLIEYGYLFIWIEKENISSVVFELKKLKFEYIENLCWAKQNLNNKFTIEQSNTIFSSSKETLFIFKRENPTKRIEIRHQRNPDSVFSFKKPNDFVYQMIETLLPENNGKLLEISYEDDKVCRPGWYKVIEKN